MQTVRLSLAAVEEIARTQPVGVSTLARALGAPKSTVQRHLRVLAEEGWIESVDGEPVRWRIGDKPRHIVGAPPPDLSLRDAALPAMMDLSAQTSETVYLAVLNGDSAVLIERIDSPQPVRTYNALGMSISLHAPAIGKAILAHLPPSRQRQVFAGAMTRFTAQTHSLDDLQTELRQIVGDRFACNRGEWRSEVAGIASAVLDRDGRPICAVGISMPMSRFDERSVPTWGAATAATAESVSEAVRAANIRL